MSGRDAWELASFVVTTLGLPFAILVFLWEQRKERDNEEEQQYQLLSDAYNDFLNVVLGHPDLQLRTATPLPSPTPEQHELGGYESWIGTNRLEVQASVKIVDALLAMVAEMKSRQN